MKSRKGSRKGSRKAAPRRSNKASTVTFSRQSGKKKTPSPHSMASMSLTALQNMAMSRGLAFGGLSRSQLREKLGKYN